MSDQPEASDSDIVFMSHPDINTEATPVTVGALRDCWCEQGWVLADAPPAETAPANPEGQTSEDANDPSNSGEKE